MASINQHKYNISYQDDTLQCMHLKDNIYVSFQRYSNDIARIYFMNKDKKIQCPLSLNIELFDVENNKVPLYHNYYLIVSFSSYSMFMNKKAVLTIKERREQVITVFN